MAKKGKTKLKLNINTFTVSFIHITCVPTMILKVVSAYVFLI